MSCSYSVGSSGQVQQNHPCLYYIQKLNQTMIFFVDESGNQLNLSLSMTSSEATMTSQSNPLSDPAAESVDQSEWEINPAAIMAAKFQRSQSLYRKYVNPKMHGGRCTPAPAPPPPARGFCPLLKISLGNLYVKKFFQNFVLRMPL